MRTLKRELWPYQVHISVPAAIKELAALDDWCKQSVGRRFVDWYSYGLGNNTRLYAFKDESTLLVFKLTWGNYGIW